ncbi:hypothetical protein [Hyunsoonleella pacifica]|uniref:hypothetical protein n=1 Tax=Hyunsoonleella pacifica TaxID=1080224 RepID=UPI0013EF00AE|nr:hypothetical protein [Hyunsoonleella pacifica]GGD06349.1 hypothetical protein GCM10011368_05280 [Hyunsoonleella pacifica]
MIFIISLLVLVILYALANDGFTSNSNHKELKDFDKEKEIENEVTSIQTILDFDFETLI